MRVEMRAAQVNRESRAPLMRRSFTAARLLCLSAGAVVVVARPAPAAAQNLSSTEQRIVSYIDSHGDEAVSFLEKIVNINSGSMNFVGVERVGREFLRELEALGFQARWVPMDAANRAGHVFAERGGGSGKTVLLIGHLDTVFEDDSPFQRWERLDSVTARGPGTEDMKGGDVVLLLALEALQAAGALDGANIIVALTGDEESTGNPLDVARADLIAAGRRADVALGFEGGVGGTNTATVARRGFTGWVLRVRGTPAHSSQIFREDLGSGAVYETARILTAFHEELRGERYLTFNPGVILGGTSVDFDRTESRGTAFGKTNVIAERAVVAGDLRTISIEQRERAKERMREIVARHLPGTTAEIEFRDSYPPMEPTPANYELLAQLDRVSLDLGFGAIEPVDPGRRGAADVSFVATLVDASLDGLGIVGSAGHTVEEKVDLRSLPLMAKRAAVLIYRLTRGDGT
jgi:glutamate carboxypeptidase